MNKGHLIDHVVNVLGLTRAEAEENIDTVLDGIARALVHGDDVRITGFGTLTVVHQAARMARNPRNGDPVTIPPRATVRFRPGVRLLQHLRGEKKLTAGVRVVGKLSRNGRKEPS